MQWRKLQRGTDNVKAAVGDL